MKFAVSIGLFTDSVAEQVAVCKQTGVQAVELSLHGIPAERHCAYIAQCVEAFSGNGIEIISFHAPFYPGNISMLDETGRQTIVDHILRTAECFGRHCPGKIVVVHPGELIDTQGDLPRHLAQIRKSLKEIFAVCDKYDLRVALENMRHGDDSPHENFKERIGENPEMLMAIIDAMGNERAGICFDTGHANIAGDILKRLRSCAGKLLHTHISDNQGVRDNHVMPEDGTIPWDGFAATLREMNYQNPVTLEITARKDKTAVELIEESRRRLARHFV